MPLYKTITISSSTKLFIWKVTESEKELSEGITLSSYCQKRYDGMKSEMHRRAFLSIRHLLALLDYVDADLHYDESGKPHLKDGKYISISHSYNFTGIIVSDTIDVGIDIEKQRDKIMRIAHKFTQLDAYENIKIEEELIRKLTVVWGCKESLYKIYAQEGLSFYNHIFINDFMISDNKTTGEIHYNADKTYYNISFMEFEGFTCVYALKK